MPRHWILLRGLIRESRYWEDFPERLAAAFPSDALFTPDLPGNGVRNGESSPLSVPSMVAFYRAELLRGGAEPPYSLIGLSLGGMVAADWASRYPGEVREVVLINSSARPFGRPWQRLQFRHWPAILKLMTWGASDEVCERTVLHMTSALRVEDESLLRHWVARRRERPVSRRNLLRQLWAAARYRAPEYPPPAPIVLLAASQDAMVDVHCSRAMARTWRLPLVEHPFAGHDLPLDDPDWVVTQIADWLARDVASS